MLCARNNPGIAADSPFTKSNVVPTGNVGRIVITWINSTDERSVCPDCLKINDEMWIYDFVSEAATR